MDCFKLVLHGDVLHILDQDVDVVEKALSYLDVLQAIVATPIGNLNIQLLNVRSKRVSFSAFAFRSGNW